MEFEKIIQERYATKLFDGRKILEEKVNKLLNMIRYAPSSFNIQPWVIKVITDTKIKEKLAPASWNLPQITSCSHLLVFCANKDIAGNIDKLERLMIKKGAKPESTFSGSEHEKSMSVPWELAEANAKWRIPRTRNQSYYNLVKHKPKQKKEER